jgi:predicted dehydrogenase
VIRVGLIGYGLAGRVFHAPLIAATPGLELTSVVTADPGRRRQVAADLPGAAVLAAAQDLWDRSSDHDLVVVAAGTAVHAAMALAAVEAGLPVVVEKPMAATVADARTVLDAGRRAGVAVVPFHNRRYDSDQLTLRRLVDGGALGELRRYESRFERWRPEPDTGAWRHRLSSEEGGGVLLDLGVHLVDQARMLLGPVTEVYAEIDARRGGADDDVFVALTHEAGGRSHLWASAVAAAPGPRLRVLGSAGAYVVEALDGQEEALRAGMRADDPAFGSEPAPHWGRLVRGDVAEPVRSEPGRWSAFYAGVEQMLRTGAPAPVAAADGVAALEVLDAARHSARRRSTVSLPSI